MDVMTLDRPDTAGLARRAPALFVRTVDGPDPGPVAAGGGSLRVVPRLDVGRAVRGEDQDRAAVQPSLPGGEERPPATFPAEIRRDAPPRGERGAREPC